MPSIFFISLVITLLIIMPVLYLWDRRRRRRRLDRFDRGFAIPLGRGQSLPPIPSRIYSDVDTLMDVSSSRTVHDPSMRIEKPLTKRQNARARRQRKKQRERLAKGKLK